MKEIPKKYIVENTKIEQQGDEYVYSKKIGNIGSVADLECVLSCFGDDWIFRGQSDASWALVPSIQRPAVHIDWDSYEEPMVEAVIEALNKVSEYKNVPYHEKLMYTQHYGGITRLLDFSYDWHIAAFFAFSGEENELCMEESKFCAIWGVNSKKVKDNAEQFMRKKWDGVPKSQEEILSEMMKTDKIGAFVYPFTFKEPKSQRIARQRGLLLSQCDPCLSFGNNLFNVWEGRDLQRCDYEEFELIAAKIIMPFSLRKDVLSMLDSSGLTKEYLLPGKEEFAVMRNIIREVDAEARKRIDENIKEIKRDR